MKAIFIGNDQRIFYLPFAFRDDSECEGCGNNINCDANTCHLVSNNYVGLSRDKIDRNAVSYALRKLRQSFRSKTFSNLSNRVLDKIGKILIDIDNAEDDTNGLHPDQCEVRLPHSEYFVHWLRLKGSNIRYGRGYVSADGLMYNVQLRRFTYVETED